MLLIIQIVLLLLQYLTHAKQAHIKSFCAYKQCDWMHEQGSKGPSKGGMDVKEGGGLTGPYEGG